MTDTQIIAVDAMGGDVGPEVTVPGAALALQKHANLSFLLCGDRARIETELAAWPALAERAEILHTDTQIAMDAKPSQAMRRGKGTSMWRALESVQNNEATVAVSAGNTGALMAVALLLLRPLQGIERPALAGLWPTTARPCVVLDVGANVGATARQLADFALMGAAMSRAVFGHERPRVGLLNVGTEELKGADEVREAHAILKRVDLGARYIGFIEGDRIGHDAADVVVVEGFAGNIALKTAEGTAKQVAVYLREAMNSSPAAKLGALLARGGFAGLRERMDPRRLNGGTFLGLNGIAIKSHGGTDALGFASAIGVGYAMARSDIVGRLGRELADFHGKLDTVADKA